MKLWCFQWVEEEEIHVHGHESHIAPFEAAVARERSCRRTPSVLCAKMIGCKKNKK